MKPCTAYHHCSANNFVPERLRLVLTLSNSTTTRTREVKESILVLALTQAIPSMEEDLDFDQCKRPERNERPHVSV